MAWEVKGTYMESCSCDAICPCIMLNAPTQGSCRAVVGWQIDSGNDDGVDLSGLHVVFLVYSEGKMHETPWEVACFFDERASAAQKDSLVKIFAGKAGGHPAVIASLVGKILSVNDAKISCSKQGAKYTIDVEKVVSVEMEATVAPTGKETTVSDVLLSISPGFPATVGTSKKSEVSFGDWDWKLTGHQCMAAPYSYSG